MKKIVICILSLAFFLRVYGLAAVPPSLYWEEAALGFDAYSILETGKDHHGNPYPLVAFESFGDWKPSLYFYAIVPFISVLGLNLWAVRLPAVLSSLAIVAGTGVLAGYVFQACFTFKKELKQKLQLLAMALATISPWAIIFSRAGWEVTLATALMLWGVISFLVMIERKKLKQTLFWAGLSVTLLVGAMYAYHAARVISPLLGLGLLVFWFASQKEQLLSFLKKNTLVIAGMSMLAFTLLLPIVFSLGSSTTTQRFTETSIFSDISVIEKSNDLKAAANNAWWAKLIYHRYLLFGKEILTNASSHFSIKYLFLAGDQNPRHSVQYMGQLYHVEVLFLVIGIYQLVKRRNKYGLLLLYWLAVVLVPASITKDSPHALRTLAMLPVLVTLICFGLFHFWKWLIAFFKSHLRMISPKIIFVVLASVYLVEFLMFARFYMTVYPKVYSQEWQYGYEQLVDSFVQSQKEYPDHHFYMTREYGRPAMYYWFYTQTDPSLVQAQETTAEKDQSEFLSFNQITFPNSTNEVTNYPAVVASSPTGMTNLEKQGKRITQIDQIESVSGEIIWSLYSVEE